MNATGKLYSAGHFATALNITKQAVRKQLAGIAPEGPVKIKGQSAQGWTIASLPQSLCRALAIEAQRRGYKSPAALLEDPPQPWTAPILSNDLPETALDEAFQWRDTLSDLLARQHDTPPGELIADGLSVASKIFGREISEATFRRHFDLAVTRDRGFEQWQRVDLYVSESAYQSPAPPQDCVQTCAVATSAPIAWPNLPDVLKSLDDKKKPSLGDRAFLFDSAFRRLEELLESSPNLRLSKLKSEFTRLLFQSVPALSKTESGLRRSLDRKFTHWCTNGRTQECIEDQRPGNSGAEAAKLCPDCRKMLVGASVELDGDVSQAWRRLNLKNLFCATCSGQWTFNVRLNKSYVPASIRDDIRHDVEVSLIHRHGPKSARLASPSVSRDWNDIGPGDIFEADDVTWNHAWHFWDTDQLGRPYVGRGECLLMVDRRTDYPVAFLLIAGEVENITGDQKAARYTGAHIRRLVLRAHDNVGLPWQAFTFENSIWRSRLVTGKLVHGWQFNSWRETESGLNDPRLKIQLRHTTPGNPRSKIIERAIGAVQNRMRPQAGFVGFNERTDKREPMQDFISRARRGLEHPGNELLSMDEFSNLLNSELMEFAKEPQNGKRLPGVSPEEAWLNGIGGKPGIEKRPLRQLGADARYLLSTHRRVVRVKSDGFSFDIGKQKYNFWGDELKRLQHRDLTVLFNIEEPEILTCLSPETGEPFIVKSTNTSMPSSTATAEQLSKVSAERGRWMKHGKVIHDNLPHVLRNNVVRDTEQDQETRAVGTFVADSVQQHRDEQRHQKNTRTRISKLAGAMSVPVSVNSNPARAAQQEAAAKRLAARRRNNSEVELSQTEIEP